MSPAVRRRLQLRPIACAIAGAGLIQVALTLWIGLPDSLYFVMLGVLLGLAVGGFHWYYTVKCVEVGTVKDIQSLFWLDAAIPTLLVLVYALLVSGLTALGVVDREIFALRTVPMAAALALFLFLRGVESLVLGGGKKPRPRDLGLEARKWVGESVFTPIPLARMDLSGEARGLRWIAIFLACVLFCFLGFPLGSLATSLVGLVALGTWTAVYAGGLALYDGARGPFCFSWWQQPNSTGWDFESRSSGMSVELHRLDTGKTPKPQDT